MSFEFYNFIEAQVKEIEQHKWIESEKAGRDLGQHAVIDWISRYAYTFRNEWEQSNGAIY